MTEILRYFPEALLGPAKLSWELGGAAISGGQTASGIMPVSRLDGGGLWKVTMTGVPTFTPDRRRSWHALTAIGDGGVQPIIVPCREMVDAPWPLVGGIAQMSLPAVPHSDDSSFSDGSLYDNSMIAAKLTAAAVLRATSLTISVTTGDDLHGGEYFSIDHATNRWRLYRIRTAVKNLDGTWAVTIRPPLREDVLANVVIEFDRPKCVMRLAAADSMDATFETAWNGTQSAMFVEAFPPFPA
jgi:hypothetical protein